MQQECQGLVTDQVLVEACRSIMSQFTIKKLAIAGRKNIWVFLSNHKQDYSGGRVCRESTQKKLVNANLGLLMNF